MWIGGAIYFNSDRTGVFNLFRYDIATGQTRQLTHYKDWDVRWPSADADGQIVYESNGELHVYDSRDDQDRPLSIDVPADLTIARPRAVNAADNIEAIALSPGGERLAVAARGEVFNLPVEHGITRNLTQSSSAHEREAAWSTDGRRLAYVSDRSGEEEIYIRAQDGGSPAVQLTSGSARGTTHRGGRATTGGSPLPTTPGGCTSSRSRPSAASPSPATPPIWRRTTAGRPMADI